MRQYDQRNLSMVMDFYEMTMSNGYFNTENADTRVAFDVFYRKNPDNGGFAIFADWNRSSSTSMTCIFQEKTSVIYVNRACLEKNFWNILPTFAFREIFMLSARGRSCIPASRLLR